MLTQSFAHLGLPVNFSPSRDTARTRTLRGELQSANLAAAVIRPLGGSFDETVPLSHVRLMPQALNAFASAVRPGASFRDLCDTVEADPEAVVLVMTSPSHVLLADAVDRELAGRHAREQRIGVAVPQVTRDTGRSAI